MQRQGVRSRISVAATGASTVSCQGAHLVVQQRGTPCGRLESDAVVLFGWNLGIPRGAEATYGKLLEHTAHAQPSQVVVVVPTDFGFDGWKDNPHIAQQHQHHYPHTPTPKKEEEKNKNKREREKERKEREREREEREKRRREENERRTKG